MTDTPSSIRVYCLDDHPLILKGLQADLGDAPDITVVGLASDAERGLEDILRRVDEIDIVVTDVEMPRLTGIDICTALLAHPNIHVVLYTRHEDPETMVSAVRAGASGMLFKHADSTEVVEVLRTVHAGGTVWPKPLRMSERPINAVEELTPTEWTIVKLIGCECMTTNEVAEHLHRSRHTIETHRKTIMDKLGLKNVQELVQFAMLSGACNTDT